MVLKDKICVDCGVACSRERCRSCVNSGKRNPAYGNKYRLGIKHTEEAKRKMVETRIKNGNWKVVSEETRRKISKNNARIWLGKKIPKEVVRKGVETRIKNGSYIFSEETRKKQSMALRGEKSYLWKGGISFEPYDRKFNNEFKRVIRKRDNQICILCNTHREKLKRTLHIHHINYDKLLSIPQNCICLCNSCHSKTNQNRKHWKTFFQNLLSDKYNYKYKDAEVIFEIGPQDEKSWLL